MLATLTRSMLYVAVAAATKAAESSLVVGEGQQYRKMLRHISSAHSFPMRGLWAPPAGFWLVKVTLPMSRSRTTVSCDSCPAFEMIWLSLARGSDTRML